MSRTPKPKTSKFKRSLQIDIANGEGGIDVETGEPQEKVGYKMVKINTGMNPSQIDKLKEDVLYYYFLFRNGEKRWYTGYYDGDKKIGSAYLSSTPYVIYYDRVPIPPSEVNQGFNKLSKARTQRMYAISKGTRKKRRKRRKIR